MPVVTTAIGDPDDGDQEPSIAIWPDQPTATTAPIRTGNYLVASWAPRDFDDDNDIIPNHCHISSSTDGGVNWTDMGQVPNPSSTDAIPTGDAKVACRLFYDTDTRKTGQLVVAYRSGAEGGDGEGTYVNFSNDLGNSWVFGDGDVPEVQTNASGTNKNTVRPCVATDQSDYAYVVYTEGDGFFEGTDVMVSVIPADRYAIGTPHSITTSGTGFHVTACDVTTWRDPSTGIDHVYVLWRQELDPAGVGETGTFNLAISESTDHGGTWLSPVTVVSDLVLPVIPGLETSDYPTLFYNDFPSFTISQPECGDGVATVFVAYTQTPSSDSWSTNVAINPSDLYLVSAPLSFPLSTLTSWGTPLNVDPNDVAVTPLPGQCPETKYTFQCEPELAPDGVGGVFLLYYAFQMGTTDCPYPLPATVLYESGGRGKPVTLSDLVHTGPDDPPEDWHLDYCGVVWDPVKRVLHPVWSDGRGRDGNLSAYTVFTELIPAAGLSGPDANPALGDLGYSNQRRIVMTGGTANLVAVGSGANSSAIYYSQQTGGANWTPPFLVNPVNPCFGTPSIGVYDRGDGLNQKAIAVAWMEPHNTPGITLCVRVREMDDCAEQEGWLPVNAIGISDNGNYTEFSCPVIAPLTATTGITGQIGRYLIGWVVTYAMAGKLYSYTLLRGTQIGTQTIQNEGWVTSNLYNTNTWVPASGPNLVLDDGTVHTRLHHDSFLSVTSNESNGNGFTPAYISDESQEIVFSGSGTLSYSGTWDLNVQYHISGTNLGEKWSISTPVMLLSPPAPKSYLGVMPWLSYDRNPCVTITSTGQKLAAWEHMDGPMAPTIIATEGGCSLPWFNYSAIKLSKTIPQGGQIVWSSIKDQIYASATDFNFGDNHASPPTTGWLRNPSITAFPKTTLKNMNTTDLGLALKDQDPGAAELLYWEQNILQINSDCTYGKISPAPNQLHERQFYEGQGAPWSGLWSPGDPMDVLSKWSYDGIHDQNGANAQRSFGIYNTGPLYNLEGILLDPQGLTYFHGLSYGMGNEVTVSGTASTIQPTTHTATPDIGAFKGTFDTALGVQLYRSEMHVKDSSMVTFKWGEVYVDDTALGLPTREIILHDGKPDTTGFASHTAMRDSIFATEWFDWPVSAEIKYHRLMLIPEGGAWGSRVDTMIVDTTAGDSTGVYAYQVYDSIPVFHPDSTIITDSSFMGSGIHMKYTVELWHVNGHIDTIERLMYNPHAGQYITPLTVHIANAGYSADTVMLRVRGDFAGIPDADSNVEFAREQMLDTYPSYGDTTIAIGSGGGVVPPPDSCFYAVGPYPNPSWISAGNVSILVHFCGAPSTITAQVYNVVGSPVGSPVTFTSDGQVWDRLDIPAPSISGTYYVHVSVGGFSTVLSYCVD